MDFGLLEKIQKSGLQFSQLNCAGVYDEIIKIRYGVLPAQLGWIYLKENKIILMHIGKEEFSDLEQFLKRLIELK